MTYDEFLIEIALGLDCFNSLQYTEDAELLVSTVKSIKPPEDRLNEEWLCLCHIAHNKHTPLETLCDLLIQYEDDNGVLRFEIDLNIERQHEKIMAAEGESND